MEQEDREELFEALWEVRQQELQGVIAVAGPPYSRKTQLAESIGRWAKCPVLCLQHLLSRPAAAEDDIKKNAVAAASDEDQVVQQAFTNLCKVAKFHLLNEFLQPVINSTVVIKSRLNSTFELQHLLHLVTSTNSPYLNSEYPLLIIECRFTDEYIWKRHFEGVRYRSEEEEGDCSWYRPGSWKEMEKVRDDYYQAQADWDLHLQQLILNAWDDDRHLPSQSRLHMAPHPIQPRRLIVDPVDIFSFSFKYLPNDFMDAIKYLLSTAPRGKLINNSQSPHHYTVEFRELRPYLIERRLSAILAAKGRSNNLCPKGECIFKYWEELTDINHVCGVCDKQVDSGTPAYTCRLCILTLHKSCAERIHFKALRFNLELLVQHVGYYPELMPKKHACKSCVDGGKGFSKYCGSCAFQTHLKCGLIPTIINHNSHPHFLSLMPTNQFYRCRACGEDACDHSYCCKPCGLYYHMKCALLPLELLKHEHGGHEHVMKLLYSHHDTDDDMEPEESYWCEVCYTDMGPQDWLYSCKDCPYYAAHLHCAGGFKYLGNVKNAKFVQQIQSQLEDAMAETCADSEIHDKE